MYLLALFALSGALTFALCYFTISVANRYRIGGGAVSSVQRLHSHWVPRLGGLAIFLSFTLILQTTAQFYGLSSWHKWWLIILPVFAIGLVEDFSARMSAAVRLLVTMLAGATGIVVLSVSLHRLDIAALNWLLADSRYFAFAITALAIAGAPHVINLIDGCNGLASFSALVAFAALGAAAGEVHDSELVVFCVLNGGITCGFLAWNFPNGRIFLGDGGAYFLGFMLAELSICLVARHQQISVWFPVLLLAHPIWETLYASTRRARKHGIFWIMRADNRHLHQLVYRRLAVPLARRWGIHDGSLANSFSALPFWVVAIGEATLGLIFYDQPDVLIACFLTSGVVYAISYRWLARYKLPNARGGAHLTSPASGSLVEYSAAIPTQLNTELKADLHGPEV